MLRRTFFAITAAAVAVGKRLRGQNRGELQRMTDEQLATTPHKSEEIMGMASADLVAILDDSDATEFAKAKACQRLALVGDDAAVPALAGLLGDAQLSHYARTALEPMPPGAADQALRDALGKLQGSLLVGVINSIGVRRAPLALAGLAQLRQSDDQAVRDAATAAINRIRRP
jgi:hypothetical protein